MTRQSYDIVIIGAGSTGCALAARLAERGSRSIALIDAGHHYGAIENYPSALQHSYSMTSSLPGDPHGWAYMGQVTSEVSYPVTRGKVFGGSSSVNGGQFTRGVPADYDGWAALGNDEWSFEKVLPYLIKLENDLDFGSTDDGIHGAGGPMPVRRAPADELSQIGRTFTDACLSAGFPEDKDMNSPDSYGVGPIPHNVINGIRQNAAVRYLADAETRHNIDLIDDALARRVVFDGTRAIGVEVDRRGERETVFGGEIVLCAGGINSAHLLMLSGIGAPADLRAVEIPVLVAAPSVGHDFMDHPATYVTYQAENYSTRVLDAPSSEVCLNYTSSTAVDQDDMRIFANTYPKGGMLFGMPGSSLRERLKGASFLTRPVATWRGIRGMSGSALRHDIIHRADLSLYCGLDIEASRGDLRLRSADPTQTVGIEYNYLTAPEDRIRLRECIRLACDLLDAPAFRAMGARITGPLPDIIEDDRALDEWLLGHMGTAYHTSGTCRMGPDDDPGAVVNQYGQVRGVDGLRVLDLSILPTLVRRGPNCTAILIGERAAEFFDQPVGPTAKVK